jgi:hypothetical protein
MMTLLNLADDMALSLIIIGIFTVIACAVVIYISIKMKEK